MKIFNQIKKAIAGTQYKKGALVGAGIVGSLWAVNELMEGAGYSYNFPKVSLPSLPKIPEYLGFQRDVKSVVL